MALNLVFGRQIPPRHYFMSLAVVDICWSALPRWGPFKHLNSHLVSVDLSWADLTLDRPILVWEWTDLFTHLQKH